MRIFYGLLTLVFYITSSEESKAIIDSYSFSEEGSMRRLSPPMSVQDFKKNIIDNLSVKEKEEIHTIRFGVSINDKDAPEVTKVFIEDFPKLETLDFSSGNITSKGMKDLTQLLLLRSLKTLYASPNFKIEEMDDISKALESFGVMGLEQEHYIKKVRPQTVDNPRFYGKDGLNSKGKSIFLE